MLVRGWYQNVKNLSCLKKELSSTVISHCSGISVGQVAQLLLVLTCSSSNQ